MNSLHRGVNSVATLLLGALLALSAAAQDISSEEEITPPENWYQVEVILFTQQGNLGGETPPQEYSIEFPDNWLELVDPNMPVEENGLPLAEGGLIAHQETELLEQRIIPLVTVQDPAISLVTESGDSPESILDEQLIEPAINQVTDQITDQYVPEYEAPFRLLDPEFRDLNESATAMARRQYNVVFHEAWRFQAQTEETDPWILIKAGQSLEGRYQIEGTLRFYKSRFLHFEPNLWLLEFANDDSRLIELPEFPVKPDPVVTEIELSESVASATMDDLGLLTTQDSELLITNSPERPVMNSPERPVMNSPERSVMNSPERPAIKNPERPAAKAPEYPLMEDKLTPLLVTERAQPRLYPVSAVWVYNRSKRVDENEIYYLDHPQMGAIVTIKAYEPELLNPPIIEPVESIVED
jgi:hypothetical protein